MSFGGAAPRVLSVSCQEDHSYRTGPEAKDRCSLQVRLALALTPSPQLLLRLIRPADVAAQHAEAAPGPDVAAGVLAAAGLGAPAGEELGVAAELGVEDEELGDEQLEEGLVALQLGAQVARVPGVGDDAVGGGVAGREGARQQHVARLGLRVVLAAAAVHLGRAGLRVELDAAHRRGHGRERRGPGHAHAARGRRRGRLLQQRRQVGGEEPGPEAVGAHLQLVALRGLGAERGRHDAGVVGEDIEALLPAEELVGGGADGGQVGEIELEVLEAAVGGGVEGAQGLDGGGALVRTAAGEVDGAVLGVEELGELEADAGVAAGDDEDAAGLVRQLGLGEGRLGDEEHLAQAGGRRGARGLSSRCEGNGPSVDSVVVLQFDGDCTDDGELRR
nr:hypothetical protein CFP56_16910 [Quercus suber]